jgi:hypothetical protein
MLIIYIALLDLGLVSGLGTPVHNGPVDLFHGLSNFDATLETNMGALKRILKTGFLFPYGARTDNVQQALLQLKFGEAKLEEVLTASPRELKIHELAIRRTIGPVKELPDVPVLVTVTRDRINYFTTDIGPAYSQYITLHFRLDSDDLDLLKQQTAGSFVVYQQGNVLTVPQALPLGFLKTIIVNDEHVTGKELATTISRLERWVARFRLHADVKTLSEVQLKKDQGPPKKLSGVTGAQVIGLRLIEKDGVATSELYPGHTFRVRVRPGAKSYDDLLYDIELIH